jgi:hypothetical protein
MPPTTKEGRARALVNLRPPWKPEQSGNPSGRKKGLVSLLKEVLDGDTLGGVKTEDGRTVAEHLADRIVAQAMKGNAPYMVQLLDRVCGKVSTEQSPDADAGRPIFQIVDNGRNPSPDVSASTETAGGSGYLG